MFSTSLPDRRRGDVEVKPSAEYVVREGGGRDPALELEVFVDPTL